jgi:hypothetical protein
LAAGLALQAQSGAVHLSPGVPIVVAAGEPEPVRRALVDLQRDLKNVLGAESSVVAQVPPDGAAIVIAGTAAGLERFRDPSVTGREAHAVFTRDGKVVLEGADMRGTIYAIYTFSEHYLGVPPLWFWSSWKPTRKASVEVPEAGVRFTSPYVRWRTWFPNDEDLLTPWRARSQENYEAFFETMLRLKMNTLEGQMMDHSSFDHPYRAGRQTLVARDRGLAVTGHHMRIFGSNYDDWDLYWRKIRHQDPPGLTVANTAALEDFWRYHIETGMREKLEMIWLLGFRSNRDAPFWELFPDAPAGDRGRARVIQDMMTREVALLKRVTGDPAPVMRVTLYNENSDFFAQGWLRPPDEPSLIWAFVAARRDHFPAPDIRDYHNDKHRPIGYYLNFQFTSSGAHLASAEGPWKMERNFRMVNAISGRPLEFSVVNAGNIREFLLELSADARMMWDFNGYGTDDFLQEFCAQYFGADHAPRVAALYRDFYQSYWQQKNPDLPGFERQYVFQDERYARAMEQILTVIPKGRNLNPLNELKMDKNGGYFRIAPADNSADSQIDAILKGTANSFSKLKPVVAGADAEFASLAPGRREFLNDNLRVQAKFMLHLNEALHAVAQAMSAMPDRNRASERLDAATRALAAMRDALRESEHDRFNGWYDGDRLFGMAALAKRVEKAQAELRK